MKQDINIPRAIEDFADRLEPVGRIINMMTSAKTMTGHPARIEEPSLLFDANGEPEYLFCNKSYGDYHVKDPCNPIYTGFLFKVHPKLDTHVRNLPPDLPFTPTHTRGYTSF